jgi:hypothetical protein
VSIKVCSLSLCERAEQSEERVASKLHEHGSAGLQG